MAPRLEGSEIITSTTDATAAEVAQFQRGDQERALDFQQFMEGTPHQQGGQHDMSPRGMTTDQGHFQQPPDTTRETLFNEPTYVQQPTQAPVAPPPAQDFQRLYGQSENEKGELRRALQAQMDANAQLLGQVQALVAPPTYTQPYPNPPYQGTQYQGNQGNGNGYGYSYAPTTISQGQPMYVQPPPIPTRFTNKEEGQMVLTEDLEATMQNVVAPAYYNLHQDTQRALGEAAVLRQMLVDGEKERRGITPQLEAQALTTQPWLRNLQQNPNPQPYLQALMTYAEGQRTSALLARTAHPQVQVPPPPPALVPGTAAAAGRRITYVEGSNTPSVAFEPGNTQSSFDREMAEATREPHIGKRAELMRRVMAKHGITQTNDWRDPSVVTR